MSFALVFGLRENKYYNWRSICEKKNLITTILIGYGSKKVWLCSQIFSSTIHLQI